MVANTNIEENVPEFHTYAWFSISHSCKAQEWLGVIFFPPAEYLKYLKESTYVVMPNVFVPAPSPKSTI